MRRHAISLIVFVFSLFFLIAYFLPSPYEGKFDLVTSKINSYKCHKIKYGYRHSISFNNINVFSDNDKVCLNNFEVKKFINVESIILTNGVVFSKFTNRNIEFDTEKHNDSNISLLVVFLMIFSIAVKIFRDEKKYR